MIPEFVEDDGRKVPFEVRCAVCHYGMCDQTQVVRTRIRRVHAIFVKPCPNCQRIATGEAPMIKDINLIHGGDYEGIKIG